MYLHCIPMLVIYFQFFIQDTKSSNGTFINNQRLSKTGEDSQVREIFSGDLLQFGVEVMETNCRGEKSKCAVSVNLFYILLFRNNTI